MSYRTLDDIALREAVAQDLKSFLVQDVRLQIIDEIQRCPDLVPEIKRLVDKDNRPGQFLLTGSAHLQSLPQTQESLAGRVQPIRLRPLTQGELMGARPNFLDRVLAGNPGKSDPHIDKLDLLRLAMRGGYPEAQHLEERPRRRWYKDYVRAIVEHDLRDITNIRKRSTLVKLVAVIAAWSSRFMDMSSIGGQLGIRHATLDSYMGALESMFLLDKIPAWSNTDYARLSKRPKLFTPDSGLMASLLRYPHDPEALSGDQAGKLMETFIYSEIAAQVDAGDDRFSLYHYRDNEQREMDMLIESDEGDLIGIEIKAGLTVRSEDFQHMRWFNKHVAGKRSFTGILLYAGPDVLSFGDNLLALPTTAIWQVAD